MTLEERLAEIASKTRYSEHCAWHTLFNNLPAADQKAITKALERQLPLSLIVKALRQEGHKTSQDALRAHLKSECRCPR